MSCTLVKVVLVTGLPGAGKSSLLISLLQDLPRDSQCAVCVHRHASAFSLETTRLPVHKAPCVHYSEAYDFGSGCLCCSPDGDLRRLLTELSRRRDELELTHLLVETTGVADPRPFVDLFARDAGNMFSLAGVVCIVDMSRAMSFLCDASSSTPASITGRGVTQLRVASVVVLNWDDQFVRERRCDDSRVEVGEVKQLVTSLASHVSAARESLPILGPVAHGTVKYTELQDVLEDPLFSYSCPCGDAPPVPPSMFFWPSVGGNHEASCETACLVVPRGGVRLDPALAILQALLDTGEAMRIQGYLAFLPKKLEPRLGRIGGIAASSAALPCLERSWALPRVTVEGVFRGKLQVRAVEAVSAPGVIAKEADIARRPWQETALEAATADPGVCRVFVCGRGVHERTLQAQLARTLSMGFQGPVCDLEAATPIVRQACAMLDKAVVAALEKCAVSCDIAPTAPTRTLGEERAAAEAFAESLCSFIECEVSEDTACIAGLQAFEIPAQVPSSGGQLAEMAIVRWSQSKLSVHRAPHVVSPFGICSAEGQDLSGNTNSKLRFCAVNTFAEHPSSSERASDALEVLVVGTQVYCRQNPA